MPAAWRGNTAVIGIVKPRAASTLIAFEVSPIRLARSAIRPAHWRRYRAESIE